MRPRKAAEIGRPTLVILEERHRGARFEPQAGLRTPARAAEEGPNLRMGPVETGQRRRLAGGDTESSEQGSPSELPAAGPEVDAIGTEPVGIEIHPGGTGPRGQPVEPVVELG